MISHACGLYPHDNLLQLLGGPFYTSVPCGRVGLTKDSEFTSNEVCHSVVVVVVVVASDHGWVLILSLWLQAFVKAVVKAERNDHMRVEAKIGSVGAAPLIQRIGEYYYYYYYYYYQW